MTPKGTPLEGNYPETYWSASVDADQAQDLSGLIQSSIKHIKQYAGFFDEIKRTGGRVAIHASIFSKEDFGELLRAQDLASLGNIGFDFAISVYHGLPEDV